MRTSVRYGLLGFTMVAAAMPASAAGSGQLKGLLDKAKQATHTSTSSNAGANLPTSDIAAGLKEALAKSTTHAINDLGRSDGFWKNAKVRIPLPGKLDQASKLARIELEHRQEKEHEHREIGNDHHRPERESQLPAGVEMQPVIAQAGDDRAAEIDRKSVV